ncbi:hypothetical protein Tco_0200233 [Tanacetum coccineum]
MSASMEARIAEHAATPTPPLPVVSSPLPLPSPLIGTDKSKITRKQSKVSKNTDTRIRRVQKEAKDSKPKPEKSSLSQISFTEIVNKSPPQDPNP